jgi:hypothetical protein
VKVVEDMVIAKVKGVDKKVTEKLTVSEIVPITIAVEVFKIK